MRIHGSANKDAGGGEDGNAGGGSGEVSGVLPHPPRVGRRPAIPLSPVLGPFAGPASGLPVWVIRGGNRFTGPALGP